MKITGIPVVKTLKKMKSLFNIVDELKQKELYRYGRKKKYNSRKQKLHQ
ncbi:hypothetical protein GL981_11815 (plasmid) [Spiroplasma citri]|nr:hypothetical protein GL981_11815 [Spiroplasma citri]